MHATRGWIRCAGSVGLVLLAFASVARGQESGGQAETFEGRLRALEQKVREQDEELERLRAPAPTAPRAPDAAAPAGTGAPTAATPPASRKDPVFEWGFDNGFFVRSELNGSKIELRPRVRFQLDYRAFPRAGQNPGLPAKSVPQDGFLIRRGRVGFSGSFGAFEFFCQVDPVRGNSQFLPLGDFWLQWNADEALKLRVGHFKSPFALDGSIRSHPYLDFAERAMAIGSGASVDPNLRPGAVVLGKLAGGLLQYWLACQNQPDQNSVASGDPLVTARLQSEWHGFVVGAAGIWDRRNGIQDSFPGLSFAQFRWFDPVSVRGWTQRYTVDGGVVEGPFFGSAAYVFARQERTRVLAGGRDGADLVIHGAHATVGWLFVGPVKGSKAPHLVPFKDWEWFSLDIEKKRNDRNVGMELLLGVDWEAIDDGAGRRVGGVSAASSTAKDAANVRGNDCKAVLVGLNVFPNENVKLMLDWSHERFGDLARSIRAHSRFADEIIIRAQIEF